MIRQADFTDLDTIMDIWLNENISAHSFVPMDYWQNNYDDVRSDIQNAEVYVYEADGKVRGFIGVLDYYIAGLFIEEKYHFQGIGSALLSYVKSLKEKLTLGVYEENKNAVNFYYKHGFTLQEKRLEPDTNHIEYEMIWKN